MKRLFLCVAVVLGMVATGFAQNEVSKDAWKMDINVYKLGKCLNLKSSQFDEVADITEVFTEKMQYAGYAKGEKQGKRLREAVYANFKQMKATLDDNQYRKYVQLMNQTLKNKGLDVYMQDMASR